jgi:periplasmic nitrate reductase NapD
MSILGVIVRARPEQGAEIERALAALPGLDIAAAAECRWVVVIEDTAEGSAAATMQQVSTLRGVLNMSLVYEYSGPDSPAPASEISNFQAWRRTPVS